MENIVNEYNTVLSLAIVEMQGFNSVYEDYLKALDDANETFSLIINAKKDDENVYNQVVKALFNKVNKLKKAIVHTDKFVSKYQKVLSTYEEKQSDLLKEYNKTLKEYKKKQADLKEKFNNYLLDCISYLDLTTSDIFTDTEFKL